MQEAPPHETAMFFGKLNIAELSPRRGMGGIYTVALRHG